MMQRLEKEINIYFFSAFFATKQYHRCTKSLGKTKKNNNKILYRHKISHNNKVSYNNI